MVDFFKFKEDLEEAKKPKVTEQDLEKDADDPCWPGYVQLGTKMKDGKEVPNCVPMEEAKKQLGESFYDEPDYGPVGASEMKITQLHFIKHAATEIIGCLESGCVMPEWYQNKVAKVEGEFEGLLSYMKGQKGKKMSRRYSMGRGMYEETLSEAKSGDKEAYTKFFNAALKKFGVKSQSELKGDKEKEFYDYIDKNWKADDEQKNQLNEVLKPSDDVSTWIEDFYKSDAPQFKGKDKAERREMAVAAWLEARREAGYDVGPNPNE